MDNWYCSIAGQHYGPVPLETLRQWAREGRLGASALVWTEGMLEWKAAGDVPELANLAGPEALPLRPHRGVVILVLGILGITSCFILGIIAWTMGNSDLRDMDDGQMDPSGRELTQAGRVCGMIGTCLGLVWFVLMCLWFAIFIGTGGFSYR